MKILHVSPSFYPATRFGGPIFSTLGLCDALQTINGIELRVLTTDTAGPSRKDRLNVGEFPTIFPAGYPVYYCRRVFGKSVSFSLLNHLAELIRWADIVHLTGVYSFPTFPVLLGCRFLGKPLVWSPRGSLQRWKESKNKRLKNFWENLANQMLRPSSTALHVTSQEEINASKVRISNARSVLIPNGVDLPKLGTSRMWMPNGVLRVIYLGRLHPIKGIEDLLDAIAQIKSTLISLTICGDGDPEYRKSLARRVEYLGIQHIVKFTGHVTGKEKFNAFLNADVCVLPSHIENFGMTVAEALAHEVPVIASRGTPWSGVETHECGFWVEKSVNNFAEALQRITLCDLSAMGRNGRAWMERDFSWQAVAKNTFNLYKSMI